MTNGWELPDTNALYGEFEDTSMHLTFEYAVSHEDYSGFTKAPHFRSYQERISGKTVKIFEFYYEPSRLYHELIAAELPGVDGERYRLNLTAICRTTNDYETARTIFRTIRFRQ